MIEGDSDSARENTELSNDENREDIDVESHGYESPARGVGGKEWSITSQESVSGK